MRKIYDLVYIKNLKDETKIPFVVSEVLGKNKSQGVYRLVDINGNKVEGVFLDEDLESFEFKLSDELHKRVNYNYLEHLDSLEDYKLKLDNLKDMQVDIIEECISESAQSLLTPGSSGGFDLSHSNLEKFKNLDFSIKLSCIEELEDYINIAICNSRAKNLDELVNIAFRQYFLDALEENKKLILKKTILHALDKQLKHLNDFDKFSYDNGYTKNLEYREHFVLTIEPSFIVDSIDDYLDSDIDDDFLLREVYFWNTMKNFCFVVKENYQL